jgi:hypothetical protein
MKPVAEHRRMEFIEEVDPIPRPNNPKYVYRMCRVRCLDGTEKIVRLNNFNRDNGISNSRTVTPPDIGDLGGKYWHKIKTKAKKRNKEFGITQEEAWQIFVDQGGKCEYTGRKITLSTETISGAPNYKKITASGDRIYSSLGYIKSNFQWLHIPVNIAKNTMTPKQFISMCLEVVIHKFDYVVKTFPRFYNKLEKKVLENIDARNKDTSNKFV